MTSPSRLPLGRLAAEFLVIVTGVLVALGAQAWYEGRQDAEREVEALRAIRDDLIRIEQEVSGLRSAQFASLEAIQATNAVLSGGDDPPPDWAPDAGLGFQQLRMPLGSVQALISSGDTRLISSKALRGDIVAYYQEQSGLELWSSQFDAGFVERTGDFINEIERIVIETGGVDPSQSSGPPLAQLPIDMLRASPEIRGFMTWQAVTSATRARVLGEAIRQATGLRHAIEEEFDSRGIEYEPAPEVPISRPGADAPPEPLR